MRENTELVFGVNPCPRFGSKMCQVSSAARSFGAKNELCKIFLQIFILGSQTEKKRDTTSVIRVAGVNTSRL